VVYTLSLHDALPIFSPFYGREDELVEVERWVVDDRCRLVVLLSIGGLGKTALSIKLAQQIAPHFGFVLWRSLQNAPPLERLLAEIGRASCRERHEIR